MCIINTIIIYIRNDFDRQLRKNHNTKLALLRIRLIIYLHV